MLDLISVTKTFSRQQNFLRKSNRTITAVSEVTLSVSPGEVVGLVGESGSGKTTLGKLCTGLMMPDSGRITFTSTELNRMAIPDRIRSVQMIFQDPFASLNPRLSIGTIISEAVISKFKSDGIRLIKRKDVLDKVYQLLQIVGLPKNIVNQYPHQFSGGQRQRVGIARTIALEPKLIIADEPVSALDVSIQAQILNLLLDLQNKFNLSYLFISHDLAVVSFMCSRIAVMYRGKIVEQGKTKDILTHPQEEYTRKLIRSIPSISKN